MYFCINSVRIIWGLIRNVDFRVLVEIYLFLICIFIRFLGNLYIYLSLRNVDLGYYFEVI